MVSSGTELSIPVIVTEQYPKGLLHTVPEIDLSAGEPSIYGPYEKTQFSMMTTEVRSLFDEMSFKTAILFGIEAHVCVQQTTFDLLGMGVEVHVLADGVASQRQLDYDTALVRMRNAGAHITTSESLIMEVLRDKNHEKFKAISALLKEPRPS